MKNEIAHTIRAQINAIDPRAFWAWGTKDMAAMPSGLRFKSSGMCRWKGFVEVTYNACTDLYTITFSRIRKSQVIVDKVVTDIYAEDLVRFVDAQVG